ncbi:hypothetical protein V9T40_005221 [Parthenolecanium corni]|uniref:Aminopeptidase n=1 Tax=Parthenolecanium corni TaxID=536013 RepID=A0AAN9THT3_9HEMI
MFALLNYMLLFLFIFSRNAEAQQGQSWEIPKNVIPVRYTLTLITFLEENNFNFTGNVIIEMNCVTETDQIVLHAKDLTIGPTDVVVKMVTADKKEADLKIASHDYGKENDFYIIKMGAKLVPPVVCRVYIKFQGRLSEIPEAYYYVSYEEGGQTKYTTSVWMEPIETRKVFPCMDEPALKATFAISMGHAPNLIAVSNMPKAETQKLNIEGRTDWVLDIFEESKPMSTYLVAFTLGEYKYVKVPVDGLSFDVGIWIREQFLKLIDLAMKTLAGALKFYTNYFKVDYALKKLDLVAVSDRSNAAMESYGMITMSEDLMTYDPKSTDVYDEYETAQDICHEVCHQWVGNYVTMKVWQDLWLSEGFCTYFEDVCPANVFPDWKTIDQQPFYVKYLTSLTSDGIPSAHSIIIPIKSTEELSSQIFDTITYRKGSVLVRMMSMILGEDVFRDGLVNYFKKYQFSSVTTDDLYAALNEVASTRKVLPENLTLKQIMDSWTVQPGYPYVDVKIDYAKKSATLSQKRYLSVDSSGNEASNLCYNIPISYTTSKNPNFEDTKPKYWLTCEGNLIIPADIDESQWLLLNIQIAGFYLTNYEENNLKALSTTLSRKDTSGTISSLDRAQIITNMFSMSWIGLLKYEMTFNIIKCLEIEDDYIPWRAALELLSDIRNILVRTEIFQPFRQFVRSFLEPKFLSIGDITKIPDDFMSRRYYTLFTKWACIYDVKSCHDQSVAIFQTWQQQQDPDKTNPILPDLRFIIYCEAAKTGGEKVFDFLYERYKNSNMGQDQQNIMRGLGCTQDEKLLQRLLDWSLDSTKIRTEDCPLAYYSVVRNDIGFDTARKFFFDRFKDLRDYPELLGWVMDRFEETVEMETSAVTIGLIDLEPEVLNDHELKTEFRVWAHKSIVNQLEYINGILSRVFHFFSEFFDIPYALEKFDLVIFPKDRYDVIESYGLVYVSYLKNSELGYSNLNQLWDVFTTTIQNNKPEILPEDINIKKIMEPWLKKIVISVMENFGARRVFPCFDQRGFKSKFTIQLKHPKGWRAFSNAKSPPSKSINDPKLPEWVMDQFEETVEMETSAVTIGLIDLEPKVLNDHELKTEFRVWADKSIVNQLEYINGILSGIFHLFSEFFDIPYALEKFDLVIFPKDIYDAVESYGLVYVSEKGVMMNSDVTASDIDQYKMLSTLCHFISKQWIGIPSQVQDAVRCQAVKSGDKKYSKLWWERLNFKQPIVGSDISKALTCSSHKSIIKK